MSNLRQRQQQRNKRRRAAELSRVQLDVQWQTDFVAGLITPQAKRAVQLAWLGEGKAAVSVAFVDAATSQQLNHEWRGKDKPTNILSFPFELPQGWESRQTLLGDLVVCVPVVLAEASEQNKPVAEHMAHLLAHGLLHLQGYDHETDAEAEQMEALETQLLAQVGIRDPYRLVAMD